MASEIRSRACTWLFNFQIIIIPELWLLEKFIMFRERSWVFQLIVSPRLLYRPAKSCSFFFLDITKSMPTKHISVSRGKKTKTQTPLQSTRLIPLPPPEFSNPKNNTPMHNIPTRNKKKMVHLIIKPGIWGNPIMKEKKKKKENQRKIFKFSLISDF